MKRLVIYPLILLTTAMPVNAKFLSAKEAATHPQMRIGALPFPFFIYSRSDNNLGRHSYLKARRGVEEDRGLIYTCRGGFIDIAHLRTGSDYVAYFASKLVAATQNNQSEITVKAQGPSPIRVKLHDVQRLKNDRNLLIQTAQYMAHNILTWHEFTTWYGWSALKIKNAEKMSGFSYEDIYSHLIGIEAAGNALKNSVHTYNNAMTLELHKLLSQKGGELERVSKEQTEVITDSVEGEFYKKLSLFNYFLYKQTNIGIDTAQLKPLLVENHSVSSCQNRSARNAHFFENDDMVTIEITPKIKQGAQILKDAASPDGKIVIERDYKTLIKSVESDILRYYNRKDAILAF